MSDEAETNTAQTKEFWSEPSPVGEEFVKHAQAMEPCARVPVYKAFGVAPGFNVGMLRKMAEGYKPKRIVVIDHGPSGFEVRRLGNNDDVSLFYASLTANIEDLSGGTTQQKEKLIAALKAFLTAPEKDIVIYDPKAVDMRKAGCVSGSYISRKLAAVAVFRNDAEGSSKALKDALSSVEAEGYLRKLEKEETNELFQTTAAVYRMNKVAFE